MSDTAALRKVGLKATVPRLRILEIMESGERRHFTAEDVYRALLDAHEEVGLATVYRVLTQFEAAGLVVRHHFEGDRSVFELGSGEGPCHHDHLVCERCGAIQEFFDSDIESAQSRVAASRGFRVTHHSLYIHGVCAQCQAKGRDGARADHV
jgi:Fur family transcriptional regulator, ferric uptake regulator